MRRAALALAGGMLLLLGHPPTGWAWAGFVALVPLVALGRDLAAGPARRGAGFGWGVLAGVVFFAPLLRWLTPFGYAAIGLLVLIMAAWVGGYVALLAWHGERRGRAVVAAAGWVVLEALRGTVPLNGFTWGGLGYTQADGGFALGVARTLGVAGVSLVLAVIAVAIEEVVRNALLTRPAAAEPNPTDVVFRAMQVPLLTVLGVLSLTVIAAGEPPAPTGESMSMGIVQAGDTRATAAAGVNRIDIGRIVGVAELMVEATQPFAEDPPDIVIWPENALDGDVRLERFADVADLLDAGLAMVAPSPILGGDLQLGEEPGTRYNNMTVFTQDGIGQSYTKRRPVPFGEYVPARHALGWFPPLEQIPTDVLPGEGPQVLEVAGAQVGGIICFENTYPSLARDQVLAGADVLVVSTNNSSFGATAMSAQHLAFSRVRAVETGRWVVHAGISGISAFISPEGQVRQETDLFAPAAPRMDVPLVADLTPAMRLGDAVVWVAALVSLLALVVGRRPVRGPAGCGRREKRLMAPDRAPS